ncbi:MAG: two-component regulator propeller domain-containing protein, partial [Phocaeicola sp.]
MMRHILLSLILLTSLTIYANDNIMFRHLTVHDGLADNEVKCIVKDNNGFVWYATNTAINRFDGY